MKRVVKLGGSLLDWPDWPTALRDWVNSQVACTTFILVGGGRAVDAIRAIDETCRLGPGAAHRAALRMMDMNSEICASRISEWPLVENQTVDPAGANCGPISWIKTAEWVISRPELTPTWEVTSDSITAALASTIKATEIVLLKSCLPRTDMATVRGHHRSDQLNAFSQSGYIDPNFETFLPQRCVIRFVSLRTPGFEEYSLDEIPESPGKSG